MSENSKLKCPIENTDNLSFAVTIPAKTLNEVSKTIEDKETLEMMQKKGEISKEDYENLKLNPMLRNNLKQN